MRPANLSSAAYFPGDPPANPAELQRFLRDELQQLAAVIALLAAGHLDKVNVEPTKPRDGDIRYADGVNFKPNGTGGAGIWYYNGSSWLQMG